MAGANPSFSGTHVHRALILLDSNVLGRKRLVKLLGVGEGSVRTIIKRLSSEGLIRADDRGHYLTAKGGRMVKERLRRMSKPKPFDSGLVAGSQSLIIVRGAAGGVGTGVALRDAALRAGADGAVVLVNRGGLKFPGETINIDEYTTAKNRLNELDVGEGDVVVIGFAQSQAGAEDGATAVALELLGW